MNKQGVKPSVTAERNRNRLAMEKTKTVENKDIISLKNWRMLTAPCSGYTPPELMDTLMSGNVYNHPEHEDGTLVTTSYVVNVDKENKTITTYSGSVYSVNKNDVCNEYEEAYPDAYERIFSIK